METNVGNQIGGSSSIISVDLRNHPVALRIRTAADAGSQPPRPVLMLARGAGPIGVEGSGAGIVRGEPHANPSR